MDHSAIFLIDVTDIEIRDNKAYMTIHTPVSIQPGYLIRIEYVELPELDEQFRKTILNFKKNPAK